jgi:hypothetical protein
MNLSGIVLVLLCLIGVLCVVISVRADGPVVVAKDNPWYISKHFHAKLGQPNYEANCDLDGNGIIDMRDISIAIRNIPVYTGPIGHIN